VNQNGIYIDTGSHNNTILSNTCTRNNNCSIYLLSAGNTVSGNNCTGNFYGIYLDIGSNNNTILENNFTANPYSGIYLYSAYNNTLSGNNCTGGEYGIFLVSGNNNTLTGNNCSGTTEVGFYLDMSNSTEISWNSALNDGLGPIQQENCVWNTLEYNLFGFSPVAWFLVNATSVVVGQWINFTDNSTVGDAPLTYWWTFGDSLGNSTLQNPVYEYAAAGNYTVTLTVTDFDGYPSQFQITIEVIAPQNNPCTDCSAGFNWYLIAILAVIAGAAIVAVGALGLLKHYSRFPFKGRGKGDLSAGSET
jgi:parallel beta-helix repeat protein